MLAKQKNLTKVFLDLDGNEIGANQQSTRLFSQAIKQLQYCNSLRSLDLNLSRNQFNKFDQNIQHLGNALSALQQCQNLQNIQIDLQGNKIGQIQTKQFETFTQGIEKLKNLQNLNSFNLNLCDNNIGNCFKNTQILFKSLSNFQQLQKLELFLANNSLGENENNLLYLGETFEQIIKNSRQLKLLVLNLQNCKIQNEQGVKYLCNGLKSIKQSATVKIMMNLSSNSIGKSDKSMSYFSEFLQEVFQAKQLLELQMDLSENEIGSDGSEGLKYFGQAFKSLKQSKISLLNIMMGYNNIGMFQNGYQNLLQGMENIQYSKIQSIQLGLDENPIQENQDIIGSIGNFIKCLQYSQINNLDLNFQNNIIFQQFEDNEDQQAQNLQQFVDGLGSLKNSKISKIELNLIGNQMGKKIHEFGIALQQFFQSQILTHVEIYLQENGIGGNEEDVDYSLESLGEAIKILTNSGTQRKQIEFNFEANNLNGCTDAIQNFGKALLELDNDRAKYISIEMADCNIEIDYDEYEKYQEEELEYSDQENNTNNNKQQLELESEISLTKLIAKLEKKIKSFCT